MGYVEETSRVLDAHHGAVDGGAAQEDDDYFRRGLTFPMWKYF